MQEQDVFIHSEHALKRVVDRIADEQWEMEMPPEFALSDQGRKVTLREVINYHAYDDAWVPDMLAGKTMDEAGTGKWDGDLLGDDPKASFARIVEQACSATMALDDPERTVHVTYGDFPAREYLQHIASFRGLRAYDIANVIGADTRLPDELVEGLWAQLEPQAEQWRELGVFGPEVAVPDDADLQSRLLGLTGRQP